MPTFKKEILPVGTYSVATAEGFKPRKFTTKDLRAYATTANKMIKEGSAIPAPFDHTQEAVPINVSSGAAPSFNNAGYWKRFWVSDETGKPTLYGELEAEGDLNKPETPAYKVGKTVKEVSIGARDVYVDGSNRTWKNAILHVALCTHPRVKNQENFELTASDQIFCMSYLDEQEDVISNQNLSDLISKLKTVAGICIPGSTNASNLAHHLTIALDQLALSNGEGDSHTEKIEPTPVFLSTEVDMKLSKEQAESIVKSGAINPATKKAFALEDFQMSAPVADPPKQPEEKELPEDVKAILMTAKAMGVAYVDNIKKMLTEKVQKLVDTGRVTKEYADAALVPQISGYQMSFQNGEVAKPAVLQVVEALESVPALKPDNFQMANSLPGGASIVPPPSSPSELTDDQMKAAVDSLLASL